MNYLEYFKLKDAMEILTKLFDSTIVKAVAGLFLVALSFGFDEVHSKALVALFILMWADCLTATYAAYKTKVEIKSSKFFRTPVKIGIYFGLIYMAHISEYAFPVLLGVLDETMIAFAVTTELISIMENVSKMGYPVPSNLIKKLINIRDKS